MVFRFFVSVKDPYVETWLGIVGNNEFNKLLYLYELDPFSNKIEFLGTVRDTPLNRRKLASWGFRDLTNELSSLLESRPTKIELFTFDVTNIVYKYPKLISIFKKFIK